MVWNNNSKNEKNSSVATVMCIKSIFQQDAVGDGRLRPGAATWRTGQIVRVVFDSSLLYM